MRKCLLLFFLISLGWSYSQTIENVDFKVESKKILISYDLSLSDPNNAVNIYLLFKDQQGKVLIPKTISGDILKVKKGEGKRILWDVLADGIVLSGKHKAIVSIEIPAPLKSVTIGSQIWTVENLNIDRFRNGDLIPEAKNVTDWVDAVNFKTPSWCYYDFDPENGIRYGKLFNWYAVNDSRGLAPIGWHIPTEMEWEILSSEIGFNEQGLGLKIKSTSGWNEIYGGTGDGTNESGFSALPGGMASIYGNFVGIGDEANWWSKTDNNLDFAIYYHIRKHSGYTGTEKSVPFKDCRYKGEGYSIRCIKN
jgi:uncharacterized protein (TIGR02145 family)